MIPFFLALLACGGTEQPTAHEQAHDHAKVEVPAEGKRFTPPVDIEEIPAGAWMCDMGTVHYASGEKNDGTCPVCGMDLLQKK